MCDIICNHTSVMCSMSNMKMTKTTQITKQKVLTPTDGETIKAFVDRCKATLTYVPANTVIFKEHFAPVFSPGNRTAKEQWLAANVGVDAYWVIASMWWFFDDAEDATWFKLSF